ncbi:fructose-bisphosphate aldolase class I [Candidatus Saccharibacteria bacterium]|nr:fructose-bisphosphate aldolase class I [Candidatus Saccharibacteria bacterium]
MHILIVGNVLKDVYLNLDSRFERFETDKNNVKWLDISFNTSEHHYFNRHSSFGGAAVSLEVLQKMGISAEISDSDFSFSEDSPAKQTPAKSYRYILISDDGVSYLTSSDFKTTTFIKPTTSIDYLYIDRSAHLSETSIKQVEAYLDSNPNVKLIIYLKDPILNSLASRASLVFSEINNGISEKRYALQSSTIKPPVLDFKNTIYISQDALSYRNFTEPITIERIDKLTHLSAYSIAAATILGGFILGESVEKSLKLARANVENSNLNSVLSLTELKTLSVEEDSLDLIAANLMYRNKGILAADESGGSIKKKFANLDIPDTFENRHNYRNIFFTTPDIEKYINGVILFDETARDYADNGQTYVDFLTSHRIIPGIKVDQGLVNFPDSDETYTKGLDDLPKRLREYREMGLRFAKWRAAFNLTLSDSGEILTPTTHAIEENCRILAEYAKSCQSAGLVPIVEPELVYDGYYSIEKCAETTSKILDCLFKKLADFKVNLRATILKVNMVLAGKQFETQSTPEEVGATTAKVLREHVPHELAGIVFLSGGQTVEQATDNLREITKNGSFPWPVTFSFARALQDPALYAWQGNNAYQEKAREAFLACLIANTEALKK